MSRGLRTAGAAAPGRGGMDLYVPLRGPVLSMRRFAAFVGFLIELGVAARPLTESACGPKYPHLPIPQVGQLGP